MKWYTKLLIAFFIIIFSPVILLGLIWAVFTYLFQLPIDKKQYKNSLYYKEFGLPFRFWRLHSPEYRFFNSYKKRCLDLDYFRQESNGLEYFIYDGTLFLFPDFDQIDLDKDNLNWTVDYDGEWKDFEESYNDIISELDKNAADLPVKLLVERNMFTILDLTEVSIPECIFLTSNYETFFDDNDSTKLLKIPSTAQELYDLIITTPNLCGDFSITDNGCIHWEFDEDFLIDIDINPQDCLFGISQKNGSNTTREITHWHPTVFEIYDDIKKTGTIGNITVIRKFMGSSTVLYSGTEADCPYVPDKKIKSGKMHYLKAKNNL